MTKSRQIFFQSLFATFSCISLSSCQTPKTYSPELTSAEIRNEEANQQRMVDEINARGGNPKSWHNHKGMRKQFERVGDRIEKAGAEICREIHMENNGCYFYFRLSQKDEINAASDGKNITVDTGMMRFVESDDELATVMGHEFAHNLMGHVKAQKTNATFGMLAGMVADAIASSEGINTHDEGTKTGTQLAVLAYSADFEKEADYVGLYVMARAGYDINKAAHIWRRMSIEDPDGIYISTTHPSNAARFVALQKAIYEVEYKRKHHLPVVPDFKDAVKN